MASETEQVVPDRQTIFARTIAATTVAMARIQRGLQTEATDEERIEAAATLERFHTGVVGLLTASLNAASAMQLLAAELDTGDENGN